jgi:hypothetical protein|tara:strand:+ start:34 stop:180 length:147 start_codon:yes stop_codon:yes gene_type:complete
MWNDAELDLLNKRIGNARQARQNSETEWSQEYWDIVLATLLRKANRLN